MTKEVVERMLWLSLLELPWDGARLEIREELGRLGMSHDDLLVALRQSGFRVSRDTVGRWLRGEGRGPALDGLRAIVAVLAEAGAGNSAKGAQRSPEGLAYALGPVSAETDVHVRNHRSPNPRSQEPGGRNPPKDLRHIPHRGDRVESTPIGGGISARGNPPAGGWAA